MKDRLMKNMVVMAMVGPEKGTEAVSILSLSSVYSLLTDICKPIISFGFDSFGFF